MSTTVSTPATAATLQESIRADMPMLLALYRDIHANPELSTATEAMTVAALDILKKR